MRSPLLPCLAPLLLLGAAGCSSVENAHRQKEPMMTGYLAGDQEAVRAVLDEKLKDPAWYNSSTIDTGDEVMWRLEAGSFDYLTGRYDRCIEHLDRAEERIAAFDQRAVVNLRGAGAESAMLITNLNALPYRGFCRDRVMAAVIKAFAYLGKHDEEGFRTELFRLREIQDQVIAEYDEYFQKEEEARQRVESSNRKAAKSVKTGELFSDPSNQEVSKAVAETKEIAQRCYGRFLNPLAIFLSGYGYARENDFQNAIVDFDRLYRAMPDHPLLKRYHVTAERLAGRDLPPDLAEEPSLDFVPGHGTVLAIFANGRGAAFRQVALYIPVILPKYVSVAAVAWPVCEYYAAPYQKLTLQAGGREFSTAPLADMDAILAQEYTERLPGMIARIVLSTAVKEFASYAAAEAARQANENAGLAIALAAAAYKVIFNTADTRTWEMLPKEYQFVEFPLPADRRITLAPIGTAPVTVEIPPTAGSAILYVNAPAAPPAAWSCQLFELP